MEVITENVFHCRGDGFGDEDEFVLSTEKKRFHIGLGAENVIINDPKYSVTNGVENVSEFGENLIINGGILGKPIFRVNSGTYYGKKPDGTGAIRYRLIKDGGGGTAMALGKQTVAFSVPKSKVANLAMKEEESDEETLGIAYQKGDPINWVGSFRERINYQNEASGELTLRFNPDLFPKTPYPANVHIDNRGYLMKHTDSTNIPLGGDIDETEVPISIAEEDNWRAKLSDDPDTLYSYGNYQTLPVSLFVADNPGSRLSCDLEAAETIVTETGDRLVKACMNYEAVENQVTGEVVDKATSWNMTSVTWLGLLRQQQIGFLEAKLRARFEALRTQHNCMKTALAIAFGPVAEGGIGYDAWPNFPDIPDF